MEAKKITTQIFGIKESEGFVVDCYDEAIERIKVFLENTTIGGVTFSNVIFEQYLSDGPDECQRKGETLYGAFKGTKKAKDKIPTTEIICRIPLMVGSKYMRKDEPYESFDGMFVILGGLYCVVNWGLQARNEVITTFKMEYKTAITCYDYKDHTSSRWEVFRKKQKKVSATSKNKEVQYESLIVTVGKKNPLTGKKEPVNLLAYIMFCENIIKIYDEMVKLQKAKREWFLDIQKKYQKGEEGRTTQKEKEEKKNIFKVMIDHIKYDIGQRQNEITEEIVKYIPKNEQSSYYLKETIEEYEKISHIANMELIIRTFGWLKSTGIEDVEKFTFDEYTFDYFYTFLYNRIMESYFPQLKKSDKESRYIILADIIYQISTGKTKDIDNVMYKTIESAGFTIERTFIKAIKNLERGNITLISDEGEKSLNKDSNIFTEVEKIFKDNFKNGIWSTDSGRKSAQAANRNGISLSVEPTDYKSTYQLAKIGVNSKSDAPAKGTAGRLYHETQLPYIAGENITEGKKCGKTLQGTVGLRLTNQITKEDYDSIERLIMENQDKTGYICLIDSKYVGRVAFSFIELFKKERRKNMIAKEASIYQEKEGQKKIIIRTVSNRPTFPYYVLDKKGRPLIFQDKKIETFDDYVRKGYIEFIDPAEMSMIDKWGTDPDEIYKGYEYVAMHPSLLVSKAVDVNSILTQHDASERITFLMAMMKAQAARHKESSYSLYKTDLAYKKGGQKPVFKTLFSDELKFTGETAFVATTGFIQTTEDLILCSETFAKRNGLIFYENYDVSMKRVSEAIGPAIMKEGFSNLQKVYDAYGLGPNGVIREGQEVYQGKEIALNIISEVKDEEIIVKFQVELFKDDKPGIVKKVVSRIEKDELVYTIQVERTKLYAESGNKFTSAHGQKGVIKKIPDEDMPRDVKTGRIFDIVNGPTGISNRRTIGQLHEQKATFAFPTGVTYTIEDLILRKKDFYIPLVHVRPDLVFEKPEDKKTLFDLLLKYDMSTEINFGDVKIHLLKFTETEGFIKYVLYSELTKMQQHLLQVSRKFRTLELHDAYIKREIMEKDITRIHQVSFESSRELLVEVDRKIEKMGYANGGKIYVPDTETIDRKTGQRIPGTGSYIDNVFVGYIYMYPLKQASDEKAHVSNDANVNPLTGDNNKGKRSNGGLRIGKEEIAMLYRLQVDKFIEEKRELSGVLIDVPFCTGCKMKAIRKGTEYYCMNCAKGQSCCSKSILKDQKYICEKCEQVSFVMRRIPLSFYSVIDMFKACNISIGFEQ